MIPAALLGMVRPWMVWTAAAIGCLLLVLHFGHRIYSNGFDAGQLHERNATREAADARQREDQRLAGQLAATARAEAAAWRDNAHRLTLENRRARSLLALAPACGPAAGDAADAGGDAGAVAGPGLRAPGGAAGAGQPQLPPQLPGQPDLWLSADAVRLWNSALNGQPSAAGACRADGTPAEACAAAVDATLADAWDNHAENAARCGIDRARHQRLIEFLQARQAGAAATR